VEIVCDGGETLGRIDTSYTGGCMGSWKKKGGRGERGERVSRGKKESSMKDDRGNHPKLRRSHHGVPKNAGVRDRGTCDTLRCGHRRRFYPGAH
jgi:hypothetical protein